MFLRIDSGLVHLNKQNSNCVSLNFGGLEVQFPLERPISVGNSLYSSEAFAVVVGESICSSICTFLNESRLDTTKTTTFNDLGRPYWKYKLSYRKPPKTVCAGSIYFQSLHVF